MPEWYVQSAVEKVFQSETGQHSIKTQVCEVVQTIATTIHQIYTLFYHPTGTPITQADLFMDVIAKVTDKGEQGQYL